jgi:hypothetical protein
MKNDRAGELNSDCSCRRRIIGRWVRLATEQCLETNARSTMSDLGETPHSTRFEQCKQYQRPLTTGILTQTVLQPKRINGWTVYPLVAYFFRRTDLQVHPAHAETGVENYTLRVTAGVVSESWFVRPCAPERTDLEIRPTSAVCNVWVYWTSR